MPISVQSRSKHIRKRIDAQDDVRALIVLRDGSIIVVPMESDRCGRMVAELSMMTELERLA